MVHLRISQIIIECRRAPFFIIRYDVPKELKLKKRMLSVCMPPIMDDACVCLSP